MSIRSIAVFCGSSKGPPSIQEAAADFAELLARQGIEIIYGGGNVGLMGIVADRALACGGKVTGVIPESLEKLEIAHQHLSHLHIVRTMSERKQLMVNLSDAFIALPGGFGTLDELMEVLTFNQLRIIDKACGVLNTDGYFDSLIQFFNRSFYEGYLREDHLRNLIVENSAVRLMERLLEHKPVSIEKWVRDIKQE